LRAVQLAIAGTPTLQIMAMLERSRDFVQRRSYTELMSAHLRMIAEEPLGEPAYRGQPGAEDAVHKAAGTVLVLGTLLLEQSHSFGRVAGGHGGAGGLDRVARPQALPLHLLNEVLAVEECVLDLPSAAIAQHLRA